jgi:excisionase family DNA binding protein
MDLPQALSKLETLESTLLQTVQELRTVKAEIQKQANGTSLEQLLGAEQVAEILGVDVAHVHAQARAGKIPSLTVGKYRRFSPAQLKKWLERKNGA